MFKPSHPIFRQTLGLLLIALTVCQAQSSSKKKDDESSIIPCPDPQLHKFVDQALTDPNFLATPLKGPSFWQTHYHPRVTNEIFNVICYPYYHGGSDYISQGPSINSILSEEMITDTTPPDPCDPCDPNLTPSSPPAVDLTETYNETLECVATISQWHRLNQSPGTALEIVFALELTKTSTEIYLLKPELAVLVKRLVGRIAQLNRQFDQTSRLMLYHLLQGNSDRILLQRLTKITADLESLLSQLAQANDAISIELGAGPVNREAAWPNDNAFINYSELNPLSAPISPDTTKP